MEVNPEYVVFVLYGIDFIWDQFYVGLLLCEINFMWDWFYAAQGLNQILVWH